MKRNFLLGLILIAISTFAFGAISVSAATEGIYTYSVTEEQATITSCDYYTSGEITIPDTLGGYPVVAIGSQAFYNRDYITSITIPDSVTSIGSYAFYNCDALTSVTIPDSVTSIGSSAFNDCDGITSITIPDSVTSIGSSAFQSCSALTSVTINGGSIGYEAFQYCYALTSVTMGSGVTSIGERAFYDCDGITSATIPDSVTSIGSSAFQSCSALTSVTMGSGVTSIGTNAFYNCNNIEKFYITDLAAYLNCEYSNYSSNPMYYADEWYLNGKAVTEIEIPQEATQIPSYAFYECSSLTSITIPDSVTIIGSSAFYDCDGITSITIPDSVTSIGSYAFYDCDSLTNVTINSGSIGENAFQFCDALTSVTIGGGVTSIGKRAFYGCDALTNVTVNSGSIGDEVFSNCSALTSVTIGGGVTSIGKRAFYGCDALTNVTVNSGSIGDEVFSNCSALTSVTIGGGVTSIGGYAFYECSSLTSITIPDSVTSIGAYAFESCSALTSVTMGKGVTSIGSYAFRYCENIEQFYITDLAAYLNCKYYSASSTPMCYAEKMYLNKKRITKIEIPQGVTRIPVYAFYNCNSLTSVTIPDTVTSIDDGAFYNCDGITSITIPDSVTSIGYQAFYDCDALTGVAIPDSVTSIGNSAFYSCDVLASITIPDSVTSIGSYAFKACYALTSITIPDSVTSIGEYAFQYCYALTSITIPDSVTSIGNQAFQDCDALTSVTIGSGLKNAGNYVFASCDNLKSVTVAEGVKKIEKYMFSECGRLTDINLPDTLETIEEYAFYNCYNITEITIPKSVIEIELAAFDRCSKISTVYYNGSQDEWDEIYIASRNSALKNATKTLILYVTLVDTDGKQISKKKYNAGELIDISDMEEVLSQIRLYTDKECTNEFDLNTPVNKDLVLTIKYVPNQYKSKFVDFDGTVIFEGLIDYGAVIVPPENPEREKTQQYSYIFTGWEGFVEGMTQTSEEMEFVATYVEVINKYTYKFVDTDGTVFEMKTVDYGTQIQAPQGSFDKEHATFEYWEGYQDGMTITEDISFTAVYKYKMFSVTVVGLDEVVDVAYGNPFSFEVQECDEEHTFMGYYTEENGKGIKVTDEKGNSIENYSFTEDITVYPYFRHELLNKIQIVSEDLTDNSSADIVKKVYFATDKDASYLLCSIKYPEDVVLKEIIAKDFKYVWEEATEVKDGYVYQNLICQYTADIENLPYNKKIAPFELVFDISAVTSLQDVNVEITSDTVLIGEEDYSFEHIINDDTEVEDMPVRSIEINGDDVVVLEDGDVAYTVTVIPYWASNTEVEWSVSDETIATVSQEGVLTPLSTGKVTLIATSKDGSEVSAQKEIEIKEFAKIATLKTNIGEWDKAFESGIREYTIYVPKNATSISFTPTFTSGTLVINGVLAINKRATTVKITNDDEKNVIFVRNNATGYADSEYKITVVRFEGTKTEVSQDGKTFTVKPVNVSAGNKVILALYDNGKFSEAQTAVYEGEALTFTSDKVYTDAKVMVWDGLTSLKPVCDAETVK